MAEINVTPQLIAPFENLGPMVRLDVKKLIKDMDGMNQEDKEKAMALLSEYVCYLENIRV